MGDNDLQIIVSHKGRIVINPNDEKVAMILAWIYFKKKNLTVYSYEKIKQTGLFSKTILVLDKKDDDMLIISDASYSLYGIKCLIVDINKRILDEEEAIIGLIAAINKNLKNAYCDVLHYSDLYEKETGFLPDMYYRDDVLTNADYTSKYVNIIGSSRYTCNCEEQEDEKVVHFFGDSRIYGLYVEDKHTIPSVVSYETKLRCINHGVHGSSILDIRGQIENSEVKKGDIIVINNGFIKSEKTYSIDYINVAVIEEILELWKYCASKNITFIVCVMPDCGDKQILTDQEWRYCLYQELQKVEVANSKYQSLDADWEYVIPMLQNCGVICCNTIPLLKNYDESEIFVDYIHFSPQGNRIIGKEISRFVKNLLTVDSLDKKTLTALKSEYRSIVNERKGDKASKFFDNEKFNNFLSILREASHGKKDGGAVMVMNANPFTFGHLYIIEESLRMFEHLYVLVVQDDHTVVPFEDRIRLITEGTKHLKGLTIIPSSEYVVSTVTLPEYFNKEKAELVSVDASRDIELFTNYVMPALNVKTRVAGEEPYCLVTREYNRQLKTCFKNAGLHFVQIERRKNGEEYISASKVRRALVNNDYITIKKYVPETTYTYLKNNRDWIVKRICEMEVGE